LRWDSSTPSAVPWMLDSELEGAMERQYRHFLLTVDESPDCLRPMRFLATLYPELRNVHVLLCHFYAPLAPIYRQPGLSPSMVAQKEALVSARQEHARAILDKARHALIGLGVTAENIQLHTQERSVSEAQYSCSLASVKRVDGVLVPKTLGGKLDGFLRGDPIPAHLRHCLAKPVWFLEGAHIDTNQAVIGMVDQEASLRAARHAGSMLAGCGTRIDLVHCDAHMDWSIISEVTEPSPQLLAWEKTPGGQLILPYLQEVLQILAKEGIPETLVRIVVLPAEGDVARSILKYCQHHHVGIVVLGHAKPEGIWSFVQNSVTKVILSEFKNMAVWVVQRGTGSA